MAFSEDLSSLNFPEKRALTTLPAFGSNRDEFAPLDSRGVRYKFIIIKSGFAGEFLEVDLG